MYYSDARFQKIFEKHLNKVLLKSRIEMFSPFYARSSNKGGYWYRCGSLLNVGERPEDVLGEVKCLSGHKESMILGSTADKTFEVWQSSKGLHGRLFENSRRHCRELFEEMRLRQGVIYGCSICSQPLLPQFDKFNETTNARLIEVSITLQPAVPGSTARLVVEEAPGHREKVMHEFKRWLTNDLAWPKPGWISNAEREIDTLLPKRIEGPKQTTQQYLPRPPLGYPHEWETGYERR